MSLGSQYDEINDFYTLLNTFINTHESATTETKDFKDRIMKNVKQLYDKHFDTYKNDEEKIGRDYKHFEIIDKKKQKSEWTEEKTKREIQKLLWFQINEKEFEELTGNIYNNQDNNDFKIIISKRTYDLKNVKRFWTEVTTRKAT